MPHLVYIVTHPMSARFLMQGQLAYMRRRGFEVTVISAPGADLEVVAREEGVRAVEVPFTREIRLGNDLRALGQLVRALRRLRPDLVNAGTPKAGLLGMLASYLARVPVRLYVLRGLRLETASRSLQVLLGTTERVAAACAHQVIAVSDSLAREYVQRGLAPAHKVKVLGAGSSNGVAVARFEQARHEVKNTQKRRAALNIPADAPVVGFVGRFTRDKGIDTLVDSFERVLARFPAVRLLLIGAFEEGDPVEARYVKRIERHPQIVQAGFVDDVAPYYPLMDVLAFPSHREGFPNVPLEAAAAGLPVVGCTATGTVDAIVDGTTGTLVPVGDAAAFAEALGRYLADASLRQAHGAAAHERVARQFRSERVWEALCGEYGRLLRARGRQGPAAARPVGPPNGRQLQEVYGR